MVESVLLWVGLGLAAGVALAQAWMATGRPLPLPPPARAIGSWACMALGALYLGLSAGEAVRGQPAGSTALAVALFMLSLAGFYAASWHLAMMLGQDEQARRAGDRAQRAVLTGLRDLGVDPALRATGHVHWAATAERLEAGLAAGVFVAREGVQAAALLEHCRVLAEAPSVLPLKLREPEARTLAELRDLQRIARSERRLPRPPARRD